MNRHERHRAAKTATATIYTAEPEHYSRKMANGLVQIDVIFGMVREPGGESEVRDAFRDTAAALREVADIIDRVHASIPTFSRGGDA